MSRRFGWILSLTLLVFGRAWSQETPRPETKVEPKTVVPVPESMPVTEVFSEPVAPEPRVFISLDYLQWWIKRDAMPALVASGTETAGTGGARIAVGGFREIFPNGGTSYDTIPGLRLQAGVALDDEGRWSIEGSGFGLDRRSRTTTFSGTDGSPFLARPFFDNTTITESAFLTSTSSAFGGRGLSGTIAIDTQNRLFGWEANVAYRPWDDAGKIHKLLFGFRQVTLTDSLAITESLTPTGGGAGPALLGFFGTAITSPTDQVRNLDSFRTSNHFYGPQVGANFRWCTGPVSFDLLTKVAVGVNCETLTTLGTTSLASGGVVVASGPGGVLAARSNSGVFSREELTVVPELGAKVSLSVTSWARLHMGYDILYLSSVARPGTQIDRRINPEQVPSDVAFNAGTVATFPRPWFRDTDFYAHGLNFGIELQW